MYRRSHRGSLNNGILERAVRSSSFKLMVSSIDYRQVDDQFTVSPRAVTVSNQNLLSRKGSCWHQKMKIVPVKIVHYDST
jgi:hypothetical protein